MAKTATAEKQNIKAKLAEAHANYIRISPRKMRLVTNMVKNMYASDAITQLRFTPKKGAPIIAKLIQSAVANATNNFKMDKDALYISAITCDGGPKLKRFMPRAQGRATEIRRPTSHIHVVLVEKQSGKKRKSLIEFGKKTAAKPAEAESAEAPKQNQPKVQHSQTEKTEQQVKANKVQQKRRLFNRKSGV